MIQTSSRCNSSCIFCPYQEVSSEIAHTDMPMELYRELIDECGGRPAVRLIMLFLMNEPLIDPLILDRVEYARRAAPHADVIIFTNGRALTPELSRGLIEGGVKYVAIGLHAHWPDTYRRITGCGDGDEVRQKVTELVELRNELGAGMSVRIRLIGALQLLSPEEIDAARAYWTRLEVQQTEIAVGHTTRAGNLPGTYQVRTDRVFGCRDGMPYFKAGILSTGDVVLCCMDWRREVILGNIREQSLHGIWNSERRREVLAFIGGERESPRDFICKRCDEALERPLEQTGHADAGGESVLQGIDILNVRTRDAADIERTDFPPGAAMTVAVRFLVTRIVEAPLIRLQIFNDQNPEKRNLMVFGTNTDRLQVRPETLLPGEWEARFCLERLNLRPGVYTFSVGIWPEEGAGRPFDVRHGQFKFRVRGMSSPHDPKVEMPARLEIHTLGRGDSARAALREPILLDGAGARKTAWETDERVRLEVPFEVPEARRYHVKVAILADGVKVHESSTVESLPAGRGVVELIYSALILLGGSYEVEATLIDAGTDEAVSRGATPLKITSRFADGAGVVKHACRWSLERP